MNFLGHTAVALRRDGDPSFVLGAVLPDLLPMAGVRLERSSVPDAVAAGWAEHHRADAAFHSHPAFAAGVMAVRTDLRATALATGPRRAAAHVGWELLLDDAVASDAAVVAAFLAALARGRTITADGRWQALLDRFTVIGPGGAADDAVVARRVQRACSRRPRLAFGDDHLAGLAAVLAGHRPAVTATAPTILDDVTAA